MTCLRALCVISPLLLGGCRTGLQVEDLGAPASLDSGASTTGDAGPSFEAGPPMTDTAVPPASDCPLDLPANGAPCPALGATCTYERAKFGPCSDVGSNSQLAYHCEDTGWLEVARCIDRTACPSPRPKEGDACTQNGLDCFYDAPTTCARDAIMQCAQGRFLAVNACSGVREAGPLVATLKDDRRRMIDGGAVPVGSIGASLAGTQLVIGALVRPAPHQDVHLFRAQTAVPSMSQRFAPSSDTFTMGEVIAAPRLDFFRDRFLLAYPVSDEADAVPGVVTQTLRLDGTKGTSSLVDGAGIEVGDVALGGSEGGFVAFRGLFGDASTAHGGFALPIDLDGKARAPRSTLVDERTPEPLGAPVRHAFARVSRWKGGYVLVAPTPARGDLYDDSGIGVWFVPLGATSVDALPKTVLTIGNQDVSLAALSDGSAVIGYATDHGASVGAFKLMRVLPDGSQHPLPPEDTERVDAPVVPALVAREDGFAIAWIAAVASPADGTMLHVGMRTPDGGHYGGTALQWPVDAGPLDRPTLLYAPVDATLHVLWTEGSPSRIYRERILVPPFGLD